MTISVPIEEHQFSIIRENGEENLITLSDANVRELESWDKDFQDLLRCLRYNQEDKEFKKKGNKELISSILIFRKKFNFCTGFLNGFFFRHLFVEETFPLDYYLGTNTPDHRTCIKLIKNHYSIYCFHS